MPPSFDAATTRSKLSSIPVSTTSSISAFFEAKWL